MQLCEIEVPPAKPFGVKTRPHYPVQSAEADGTCLAYWLGAMPPRRRPPLPDLRHHPDSSAGSSKSEARILVLEPDESLVLSVLNALHDAAPAAVLEVARNLEEAHRIVLSHRPDLFVLDMDAAHDLGQDFLIDLRTSHPEARAIVLTAVHLAWQREQAAGIGAIHFLEKPVPHSDFVDLAQALLRPSVEGEKFQGTLRDLHLSDIIQLKCMSGATSALEITGPAGEKARVYFDNGQVCHAVSPGCEGVRAFNEIVSWKSGNVSEVAGAKIRPAPSMSIGNFSLWMRSAGWTRRTPAGSAAKWPAPRNSTGSW